MSRRRSALSVVIAVVFAAGAGGCNLDFAQRPLPEPSSDDTASDAAADLGADLGRDSEAPELDDADLAEADGDTVALDTGPGDAGDLGEVDDTAPDVVGGCGDGAVDADEACDDGNRLDGDGCSAECDVVEPLCGEVPCRTLCVGSGRDGVLDTSTLDDEARTWDAPRARVLAIGDGGELTLDAVVGAGAFEVGDEVLVLQMRHVEESRVGQYVFARVAALRPEGGLVLDGVLPEGFEAASADDVARVQVVGVRHYLRATVAAGDALEAPRWDGSTGGVLAMRVQSTLRVEGTLTARHAGYQGGGGSGEGYAGGAQGGRSASQGCGGGEGLGRADGVAGGGGGGHAGAGEPGEVAGSGIRGEGGLVLGVSDLRRLTLGGGGGSASGVGGGCCCAGAGGGIVFVAADRIELAGRIDADGESPPSGTNCTFAVDSGGAGGGAGGSVALWAQSALLLEAGVLSAAGGHGGGGTEAGGGVHGGDGASGRIALAAPVLATGVSAPEPAVFGGGCRVLAP